MPPTPSTTSLSLTLTLKGGHGLGNDSFSSPASLHPASHPGTSKFFSHPPPSFLLVSNDERNQDLDTVARVRAESERGVGVHRVFRRAVDQEFPYGLPFSRFGRLVVELVVTFGESPFFSLQHFHCVCPQLRTNSRSSSPPGYAAAPPMRLIRGHNFARIRVARRWCARNPGTHNSALRRSGGDETKREPASVSPFRPKFCVTARIWVHGRLPRFWCLPIDPCPLVFSYFLFFFSLFFF